MIVIHCIRQRGGVQSEGRMKAQKSELWTRGTDALGRVLVATPPPELRVGIEMGYSGITDVEVRGDDLQ